MSGTSKSGRKKEPVDVRLRRGTLKPGDVEVVPEVSALPEAPDAPRPLGTSGRALWAWAWRHGSWLHLADAEMLAILCEQMDERQIVRGRYLADPDANWRLGVMARKLEDQIRAGLSDLGFDPTARARMNLAVASTVEKVSRVQAKPGRKPMTV